MIVATKPQYFDIINGNPYIDKWIAYQEFMDNPLILEGMGDNPTYCDITYNPYLLTQRMVSYTHNGIDKIDLNLNN